MTRGIYGRAALGINRSQRESLCGDVWKGFHKGKESLWWTMKKDAIFIGKGDFSFARVFEIKKISKGTKKKISIRFLDNQHSHMFEVLSGYNVYCEWEKMWRNSQEMELETRVELGRGRTQISWLNICFYLEILKNKTIISSLLWCCWVFKEAGVSDRIKKIRIWILETCHADLGALDLCCLAGLFLGSLENWLSWMLLENLLEIVLRYMQELCTATLDQRIKEMQKLK